jgi:mono/diheme cytochrome c family protein
MDEAASPLEKWAARSSLHATLKREATESCPIAANEENLMAGAKIYSSNCSVCHGTPIEKIPPLFKGITPAPPLFANDPVTDDPESSTHWRVEHGIRFTAMPSFKQILSSNEMWQVTLFLRHMDKLPAPVDKYWSTMK